MRSLLSLLALVVTACGSTTPAAEVPRRMGGQVRLGAFVSPSQYEAFIRAEVAMARGDLEGAIYQYRVALSGADEDPYVHARLALAFDAAGQAENASDALQRALDVDPESEAAWLARGDIAARHQQTDSAITAYEHAASAPIHSTEARLRTAALLRTTHNEARADAVLEELVHEAGDGTLTAARARLMLAIARNDATAMLACAREILRIAPMRSDELRAIAIQMLNAGRAHSAVDLLIALPEREDDIPLMTRALLEAGLYSRAESYLATHDVRSLGTTLDLARVYLAARRPERALELAEGALTEGLNPAEAHQVAAEAAYALFHNDLAAMHLAAIAVGSRGYAASRALLAHVLQAEGMHAEAVEVLVVASRTSDDPALTHALEAIRREGPIPRPSPAATQ